MCESHIQGPPGASTWNQGPAFETGFSRFLSVEGNLGKPVSLSGS